MTRPRALRSSRSSRLKTAAAQAGAAVAKQGRAHPSWTGTRHHGRLQARRSRSAADGDPHALMAWPDRRESARARERESARARERESASARTRTWCLGGAARLPCARVAPRLVRSGATWLRSEAARTLDGRWRSHDRLGPLTSPAGQPGRAARRTGAKGGVHARNGRCMRAPAVGRVSIRADRRGGGVAQLTGHRTA